MFHRVIEKEIIPVSEKHGIGQVVWSPLAQGVLAGKYKKGESLPEGSRATTNNTTIQKFLNDEHLDKVEQLTKVAKELGITLSQLAIAWILRQPNVASALVGASRPEQIEENVKASGIVLAEETLNQIEAILSLTY